MNIKRVCGTRHCKANPEGHSYHVGVYRTDNVTEFHRKRSEAEVERRPTRRERMQ